MADNLLEDYSRLKEKDSNLQTLHDILVNRNSNLTMGYGSLPRLEDIGQYKAGFIGPRTITIDPEKVLSTHMLRSALNHELTHAVGDELSTQRTFGRNETQEDARFRDAYDKLNPRSWLEKYVSIEKKKAENAPFDVKRSGRIREAQAILDNRNDRGELYRGNSNELRAYGVGNSVSPKGTDWPGSSHLDATMATEAAILNDLAERARKSKPLDKQGVLDSWIKKYFSK
jgi:hypothetical protein